MCTQWRENGVDLYLEMSDSLSHAAHLFACDVYTSLWISSAFGLRSCTARLHRLPVCTPALSAGGHDRQGHSFIGHARSEPLPRLQDSLAAPRKLQSRYEASPAACSSMNHQPTVLAIYYNSMMHGLLVLHHGFRAEVAMKAKWTHWGVNPGPPAC